MRACRATLCAALLAGSCAAACGGRSTLLDAQIKGSEPQPEPGSTSVPDDGLAPPGDSPFEPELGPEPEPEPPIRCQQSTCPDDGDACNGIEVCDRDTDTCVHVDAPSCDDGLDCNGTETCAADAGCVAGEPIVCEAPGAYCDENVGRCACDEPFVAPDCLVKTALFAHFGQVRELAEQDGVLWITTDTGLWALDFGNTPSDPSDDLWLHFDELTGASNTGALDVDPSGIKWFAGNSDRQLARFDDAGTPLEPGDDTWYFYRSPEPGFIPSALGVDGSSSVWLGRTGETLVFRDPGTPENRSDDGWLAVSELGAPEELVNLPNVDAMLSEPPGVLWMGSSNGGLFAYDSRSGQYENLTSDSWQYVHDLVWEDDFLWYSVGFAQTDAPAYLARNYVQDTVIGAARGAEIFQEAPDTIESFDVDAGGHAWVSHPTSGLSCLEVDTSTWSRWELSDPITAVLIRSSEDLWLGGESIYHVDHGGSCEPSNGATQELVFEQTLRSPARDVEIEGGGLWIATDRGVDYFHPGTTPFERGDDRWAHFDAEDIPGLEGLQGVQIGQNGIKYFWGQERVHALDDRGTPFDPSDDSWVAHDTDPLWVSGVVDADGRLLVVALTGGEVGTARIVVFDPEGTPEDGSDDVVITLDSGLPGFGRNMTIDTEGQIWLGTETQDYSGNLFHWDRRGTPLDGSDDVWTPVLPEDGRVWKLEGDPTGGVWGTVNGGVFHFFDGGTPTDLADDYWHVYPELGSAMDIGPGGVGWFRMPGGAGILDVGGTPRDPSDDVARVLLSPDALRFRSDLYTNGRIDEDGRFWVVDEYVQVFEAVE